MADSGTISATYLRDTTPQIESHASGICITRFSGRRAAHERVIAASPTWTASGQSFYDLRQLLKGAARALRPTCPPLTIRLSSANPSLFGLFEPVPIQPNCYSARRGSIEIKNVDFFGSGHASTARSVFPRSIFRSTPILGYRGESE